MSYVSGRSSKLRNKICIAINPSLGHYNTVLHSLIGLSVSMRRTTSFSTRQERSAPQTDYARNGRDRQVAQVPAAKTTVCSTKVPWDTGAGGIPWHFVYSCASLQSSTNGLADACPRGIN